MSEKKRYIVEADEHVQMISLIGVREGTAIMITGNVETFQTADKALKEAYHKDFEAGQHESTTLEYQQGLDDAWKCARKIAQQWEEDTTEYRVVMDDSIRVTLDSMTASEAIEKIKAYEEQQKADDEIKVGDEVTLKSNNSSNWLGVVVRVDDTNAIIMTRDGYTTMYRLEILKKTNKHFPQMAELLKSMKDSEVTE